jgi:hypothetical protein
MRPELQRPLLEPHVDWRYRCLHRAGFSDAGARRLAADTAFDLHALLELVDRGCPPDVAVRIVAPLDWEPRSP